MYKKFPVFTLLIFFSSIVVAGSNLIHINKYPQSNQHPDEEFYLDVYGSFPVNCYQAAELSSQSDSNLVSTLNVHYPFVDSGPCIDGVITPVTVPFRDVFKVRQEFVLANLPFADSLIVNVTIENPMTDNFVRQSILVFEENDVQSSFHLQPGLWKGGSFSSRTGLYFDQKGNTIIINPLTYDDNAVAVWNMAVAELNHEVASGVIETYKRTNCELIDYNCQLEVIDSETFDLIIEGHNQILFRRGTSSFSRYNTLSFGENRSDAAFSNIKGSWIAHSDSYYQSDQSTFLQVEFELESDFGFGNKVFRTLIVNQKPFQESLIPNYLICDPYTNACYYADSPDQNIEYCYGRALLIANITTQFLKTSIGPCLSDLEGSQPNVSFYRIQSTN